MKKSNGGLALAKVTSGKWSGIDFTTYMVESASMFGCCPIIKSVCGETIDYGRLFAYCFRRFGYPNVGWDDYKQLAQYTFSTSHPDLLLLVSPYAGGSTDISLRFAVSSALLGLVADYGSLNGERYYRPECIESWSDDDPLKSLACAAVKALSDLKRPVFIRDIAINALGVVDIPKRAVKPAGSAGYPSGALGNAAPREFSQLHELIIDAGGGNAKRGIKKIMSALR